MERYALQHLVKWKTKPNRKPLILRGARQVGKTELVRIFADREFEHYIELNFDEKPEKAGLFRGNDVHEILRLLEIDLNTRIQPGKTLLFFDEIQAAPDLIHLLRYFYEKLPELHVLCAGSLLDFVLSETTFSVPVGRVEYMFLGPMSFEEFLLADGQEQLTSYLKDIDPSSPIPPSIHEKLQKHLREFMITGGMPGVLKAYHSSGKDLSVIPEEQRAIIRSYYDDFGKYREKINLSLLQRIYRTVPAIIGKTTKYTALAEGERIEGIKECLELLEKARILYRVVHSDGNGVPLAAEHRPARFKTLFLDVGLMNSFLGLKISDFYLQGDYVTVHSGALAEQFIGQHLMYRSPLYEEPELFYWNRIKKGSSSEVDYLIGHYDRVIPVEVKAGKAGRLKSLQVFVTEKNTPLAVRYNADIPSVHTVTASIPGRERKTFTLLSLPVYLVEQVPRLVELVTNV